MFAKQTEKYQKIIATLDYTGDEGAHVILALFDFYTEEAKFYKENISDKKVKKWINSRTIFLMRITYPLQRRRSIRHWEEKSPLMVKPNQNLEVMRNLPNKQTSRLQQVSQQEKTI